MAVPRSTTYGSLTRPVLRGLCKTLLENRPLSDLGTLPARLAAAGLAYTVAWYGIHVHEWWEMCLSWTLVCLSTICAPVLIRRAYLEKQSWSTVDAQITAAAAPGCVMGSPEARLDCCACALPADDTPDADSGMAVIGGMDFGATYNDMFVQTFTDL